MEEAPKELARRAFAARFREALGELGISAREQGRLQRTFGVSGQAVRKWLDGTAIPTSARIPRLAAVLGVNPGWLQYGEGPMRPRHIAEEPGSYAALELTAEEARLLTRYRALSDAQRAALDLVLKTMVAARPEQDST